MISPNTLERTIPIIEVTKESLIQAPIDITFEAILAQMGPEGEMPDGKPFPMVLEAWPGGRWYRDLGSNTGHFWGHVQVIKPPTLIEVCGPLFMSVPAANHFAYRLTAEGDATRLNLVHRGFGLIPVEFQENVGMGWQYVIDRIGKLATQKRGKK